MFRRKISPKLTRKKPTMLYGYARVSTYGHTLAAQLDQLRAAGCEKIYREQASGARADRRELLKLLKTLDAGDVVTVTRIDRLARSVFDLFAIVKHIADAGAQFAAWPSLGRTPAPAPGGSCRPCSAGWRT
jgi:DNA invertase Pin-like site-specific DNA recombinase